MPGDGRSVGDQLDQWRALLDQHANQLVADCGGSTAERARWAQTEMAWQQTAQQQPQVTRSSR